MNKPAERLTYRVNEVAAKTGATPSTVRRWLDEGHLRYVQVEAGGVRLIPAQYLETFLKRYERYGRRLRQTVSHYTRVAR
jgi:excisionase family DNA binding protein